ncbi:MAG: tetratricopeptide repeat protein [Bacteroidales bacterium]|nr:tetratricopeptide repeat protein [Bacteroidales bacterium]
MKMKFLTALTLVVATVTAAFASDYKDGIEYFKAGQIENAKTILERTINDATTNKAEAYYYLGEIAFVNKNYDEAAKYYAEGVVVDPEYRFNLIGQGKLQLMSDAKAAAKTFKEAVKGYKKEALAPLQLAVAKAYYETATPGYEKPLAQAKKANSRLADIYVFEGDIFAADGDKGQAAGYYEMAKNFDVNCVEAYIKYCHVYFDINSQMAIAMLEELNQLAPNSALAQRELAEAYYKDKQYTRAAAAYEHYVANPNHFEEDRVRLATLLFYGKRFDESYALAQEILANDPSNFVLNRIVMYNLYETTKYEDARVAARKFFELTPSKNQVFIDRDYKCYGDILMKLKMSKEAAAAYIKAFEMDKEEIAYLMDVSRAYETAEMFAEAINYFDMYIDAAGDGVRIMDYFRFGQTCYRVGMADTISGGQYLIKADTLFAAVTEKAPENYLGHQWRARVAAARDPETTLGLAKPFYERTIEVLDTNVAPNKAQIAAYIECYKYLGYFNYLKAYAEPAKANEYKEQTRYYWNKMLEYDPNNAEITEALKNL